MKRSPISGHRSRTAAYALAVGLLTALPAAHAQTTDTWSAGTSGDWNVASDWSADVVPNNGTPSGATYNVDIVDGVSTVTLNISAGINDLTLASGNTLVIPTGETLTVSGPTITNNGAIQLNGGAGNDGVLSINGSVTLSGSGRLTLSTTVSGGGSAYILENTGGSTLTNSGSTIQGSGIIGNGGLTLVNGAGGTIDANVSGGSLTLNGTGGITNTGLLEATSGGNLAINDIGVTNTGGNITASGAGSVVSLPNASITGGTFNTSSGGVIESGGTTTLSGVTISTGSTYTASDAATTLVLGTITNDGIIQINGGSGSNGVFSINGNTTLTGGGTVTLSTTVSGGGNAYIMQNASGLTLTNTNNLIQGNGIIGNGALTVVNSAGGTVDANVSGGSLTLNGTGGITNTGLLEATSGGNLAINDIGVTNTGGNITASGSGSVVSFGGGTTITGGDINTSTGGVIESTGTVTLSGVTIPSGSAYTASDGTTNVLLGTITNSGTINLSGGNGSSGVLALGSSSVSAVTLQGGGIVNLSTTAASGGSADIEQNASGVTLTNVNNTIQGEGVLGNGALTFVNEASGTVDANSSGSPLTSTLYLNGSGGVTNTGLLEATNSGVLQISTTVDNAGGTIKATGADASVQLTGATITGGTLTDSGGGAIETTGNSTLDGSTSAGAITLSKGSVFTASDGVTTVLLGTITNDGTIDLNGGNGSNEILALGSSSAPALTLQGGGTVNISTIATSGGAAYIEQNASSVTLTNVNNTIQGEGVLGNGGLTFVNDKKGTVDANSAGGTLITQLVLNGSGGITNEGLLEATNSGVLQIQTAVNNAGGTIQAVGASAQVQMNGATITGGTLTDSGGGVIQTTGNSTLSGVTLSTGSTFTASDAITTLILGTITNDGTIQLNGGNGNNGVLGLNGNTTLTGGGTVTMSTATGGGNAFIEQNAADLTLTNTNNSIQGNGIIGNGGLTVVNSPAGTIDANVSGGVLYLNGSGGVTNTGLLEATGGGQLALETAVTNTKGNISASGTGSLVTLNGATITSGTLNSSGGGLIETTGTSTLNGVTLSIGSTYTSPTGLTTLILGTITNEGTIQLNGGNGANGFLSLNGNTTLTGGGTLTMSTVAAGGGNAYIQQNASGLTLTNDNNTIQGNGIIGNGGLTVVNEAGGTISSNAGTLLMNGSGGLTNDGTLAVSSGDVLHVTNGPFTNFSGTTLTGGTYSVSGTLEIDELGSTGGEIVTDAANIIMNGLGASFIDDAGDNAISKLATIAATGSFSILGGYNFTTAGNFTNNGTLSVGSGSTFAVTGSLSNFSGTTLTGGTYDVTGTLEFPGANIVTNAASITLGSPAAEIENSTTSGNGLASFATNGAKGSFTVAGGTTFTTAGNFTNDGTLSVGSGSTFAVAPSSSLTNFSGTTLTSGTYDVTGTLEFAGADIVTDAANITLSGSSAKIENSTTGANALAGLDEIAAKSSFTLAGGANFTTAGNFDNKGTLSVGAGSTFAVATGSKLTNFSSATDTLTGGTYDLAGTLEFAGADVVTNAAKITLTGSAGQIENSTTSGNGLANFATNASTGSFSLSGGANFSTSGSFSNAGTLTVASGSTLTVGGAGAYTQTAGTTTDGGTLSASGGVTLSAGSLFGGGAATVSGNLTSSGTVTPGASSTKTGILTDAGTYTQNSGGSLDIGIGGTTAGKTFDVLDATTAVLGGTLNISQISSFVPKVGAAFTILNFNSETGTFATVNGLTINSSEAYTITYQSTDVLLTVVSTGAPAAPAAARIADTRLIEARDGLVDGARLTAALEKFNAANADGAAQVRARNAAVSLPGEVERTRLMDLIKEHR